MSFEVKLYFMKYLCLLNVNINIKFNQNISKMNVLQGEKLKSRNPGVPEFFVRYRRAYVLKKLQLFEFWCKRCV